MATFLEPSRLCAAAITCAILVHAAAAQGGLCQVRNRYRIANSHSGAPSELNVDTGWVQNAPLTTPGFNSNPGASCSSQGSCTPTADFGYLRVVGTGSANNGPTGGVFLWLDSGPQASFHDTMTVTSSTLPANTPVQVRFRVALDGFASVVDTNPSVNYAATVSASSLSLSVTNTNGIATGVLNTYVGSSVLVAGDVAATLLAYGLMGFGIPPMYGSYSVDLTARVGVECLTPGASVAFCSGRSYATLAAEVVAVGAGCGVGPPVLSATLPVLGQTQSYALGNAPAGQAVFLAFAPGSAVNVPVGPCTIAVDGSSMILLFAGVTDAAGAHGMGLALPATPGLAGLQFTTQQLVLAAGGALLGFGELSNGLQSTLGL